MKARLLSALTFLSVCFPAHSALISNDYFTLWQYYSVAPNTGLGDTPSWLTYVDNIRAAASSTGLGSAGDPNTPGYFTTTPSEITIDQAVVTDATGPGLTLATGARRFNSWRGQANPGEVFGAAFANEYGSRIHTPLLLVTDDTPITITSIEWGAFSTAYGGYFNTGNWTTWGTSRVGVSSYGANGVLGGGDDVYLTSGEMNTSAILAVIATGTGYAHQMSQQFNVTPWDPSLPDEEIFTEYLAQWGNIAWDFRMDYAVNFTASSNPYFQTLTGDTLVVVPEPGTFGLISMASILMLSRRRRR
jgi:hypothetical protein